MAHSTDVGRVRALDGALVLIVGAWSLLYLITLNAYETFKVDPKESR